MREILFRGKRVYNRKWITGYYSYYETCHDHFIITDMSYGVPDIEQVYPETVGQYTGFTDKNGKRIFEGDIMAFCKGATRPFEIRWDGLGWKMFTADGKRIKDSFESGEIRHMQKSEVIGNKWDNPELLEVKE